jgi:hypothetical protein
MKKVALVIGLELLALSLLVLVGFGNPFSGDSLRAGDDHPDPFPELPPWPPASASASNQSDGVLVEWVHKVALCAPSNVIHVHYAVYRRESGTTSWTEVHQEPGTNDCREVFQFLDTNAESGSTYAYGVSIISQTGRKEGLASEILETDAVTAP